MEEQTKVTFAAKILEPEDPEPPMVERQDGEVREVPPPPMTPMPSPRCEIVPAASEMVEALPTILCGIGLAYLVGVATGAVIFSPPSVTA